MSSVNPQGQIYLCKTPLEADYKNQLTFANATAQLNYFAGTVVKSFDNNTYMRKDGGVKVNCNIEEIRTCNYMYYKNTGFSNKIYYAFITSLEYLSEDSTLVRFETDCFQTWYFDLVYKPCFVEREHVADDTIGLHTVPEGLETGEYRINETQHIDLNLKESIDPLIYDKWYICFVVTSAPDPNNPIPIIPTTGYDMGAVFTPLTYFAVKSRNGYQDARNIIEWYRSSSSTTDKAIVNMYMIPYSCVDTSISQTWTNSSLGTSITVYAVKPSASTDFMHNTLVYQSKNMDGLYQPKNNKLYTYPYCYFYLSNKCGSEVVYKWEDCPTGDMSTETGIENDYRKYTYFNTYIVPSTSLSARAVPERYKGKSEDSSYYSLWDYGISYGKVPVCAWTNDYYTNWLTQNGVNMGTNVVSSVVSGAIAGSTVTGIGALVGGATSGILAIMNNMAKTHQAEVTPDQANGDINTGDVSFAFTLNNITIYHMTIRKEMAELIDSYFNMFGYKVNVVKTPQFNSRTYWNYVKTVDCNIEGDIPQEDLQIVRNMFNKGCTFWHGASNMYNYNLTNSIVS